MMCKHHLIHWTNKIKEKKDKEKQERRLAIISYLESPHISWVSSRLQTVLVTFEEKLQEEPAKVSKRTHVCRSVMKEIMKESRL